MKVKIEKLVEAMSALKALLPAPVKSAVVAYRLQNNLRKIESELSTYYEVQGNLLREYAKMDEKGELITSGNNVELREETAMEYHEKVKELQDEEVNVNIKLFTLDDLDAFCESEALTSGIVYLLEWMIEDE